MTLDKNLKNKNLALFFTYGISLKFWHEQGMIDREVALYNNLSNHFKNVYLFTYGNKEDLKFKDYLNDNIVIVVNTKSLHPILYSLLIPLIHRETLKKVDLVKTNQMMGSWAAVLSKYINKNILIIRAGYILSMFKNDKKNYLIERFAYKHADAIITSSKDGFEYIEKKYAPKGVHQVIYNYVETNRFKPLELKKTKNSVCFVGRLNKQKNLFSLIEAFKDLPYYLEIIGSGELEEELKIDSLKKGCNVIFSGNIANKDLPSTMNKHEIFILPSFYEGMPKTLIEAMACGLPVIGTKVKGIKEVLINEYNGILCETNPLSIRNAIQNLIENNALKSKIGKNARNTILDSYSLEKISLKELELMKRVLGKNY